MTSNTPPRCFLGIDAGGTKCDALLVGEDGSVLGIGRCKHTDPESGRGVSGSGRARESIMTAVRRAIGDFACGELHVAGTSILPESDFPGIANVRQARVRKVTESDAVFAINDEDAGVIVLSGTGAFVDGRTRDGRQLHLDGLGPILGDHGSGYQIGLLALRAAARSLWRPRHQTSLAKLVQTVRDDELDGLSQPVGADATRLKLSNLVNYTLGNRDRSEIASFTRIVDAEANAGDPIARGILEEAAADMAETLFDVVDCLEMAQDSYKMLAAGGVATHCRIYWEHLCRLARRFAPKLEPIIPDMPPVVGAAVVAAADVPGLDRAAFRENLFRSVRERMNAGSWLN